MDAAELKKMTRAELIKAAQNLKISGSGKLKKDELIEAILFLEADNVFDHCPAMRGTDVIDQPTQHSDHSRIIQYRTHNGFWQ